MFKATVKIDDASDQKKILKKFEALCSRSGFGNNSNLYEQVEHAVNEFSIQGSELMAVGSQFNVTRVIEDEGYKVVVEANYGQPRSIVSKMLSAIGIN